MANDPNNPYRPLNTTNYDHPRDPNLNDLHSSMEYNAIGQPVLRANVNLVGSGEGSGVSSSIDSKGRLKVQTQQTLFFNTFQYGKETDVWDESVVNGASAVFDTECGIRC